MSILRAALLASTVASPFFPAAATPVYLRLDSLFPSGHYTRQTLEARTKKVQFQRWLRVETKDGLTGWLPEDHCLTAIRLAGEAALNDTVPVRTEMVMDSGQTERIAKGTRVAVDEVEGSWVHARFHTRTGEVHDSWIPSEALTARLPAAKESLTAQKIFIPGDVPIRVLPGDHARVGAKLAAGTITTVVRETDGYLEIHYFHGTGFLRRQDIVTLADLGAKGARPLSDLVPLRTAPLPYADLSRNLPISSTLKITGTEMLRWGLAKVPEIGEMWWPIADRNRNDEKEVAPAERITSGELFRRKIFDMASSPAIPSLKFVSAQGVFRTVDGNEWTKISTFEDKNYPIAIAGLGSIFVGPYVSDDHGETFQQWIRWDSLVAVLRRHARVTPQRLQIREIRPEDPAGRRVVLKLSMGSGQFVKLVTEDQGHSWRPVVR